MEDVSCVVEKESMLLASICDGHGGSDVSHYVAIQLEKRLTTPFAIPNLIKTLDEEVIAKEEWEKQGTTLLTCCLDKATNSIATVTLGDSEAVVMRNGELIPLSCVRNWASPKDAERAVSSLTQLFGSTSSIEQWTEASDPKKLRFPPNLGLNVSRAIGDLYYRKFGDTMLNAISQKPKMTHFQLQPGDLVILGCDGLFDFVPGDAILDTLAKDPKDPSEALTDLALQTSKDNVSIITIQCKSP